MFSDDNIVMLADVYQTVTKELNMPEDDARIHHRVRSCINSMVHSGIIVRLGPCRYQINLN